MKQCWISYKKKIKNKSPFRNHRRSHNPLSSSKPVSYPPCSDTTQYILSDPSLTPFPSPPLLQAPFTLLAIPFITQASNPLPFNLYFLRTINLLSPLVLTTYSILLEPWAMSIQYSPRYSIFLSHSQVTVQPVNHPIYFFRPFMHSKLFLSSFANHDLFHSFRSISSLTPWPKQPSAKP